MLSNPIRTLNPLAIKAKKIDIIMVKIIIEAIFSLNILDLLSSGDKVPICRLEFKQTLMLQIGYPSYLLRQELKQVIRKCLQLRGHHT